jgi:hypothetical protein
MMKSARGSASVPQRRRPRPSSSPRAPAGKGGMVAGRHADAWIIDLSRRRPLLFPLCSASCRDNMSGLCSSSAHTCICIYIHTHPPPCHMTGCGCPRMMTGIRARAAMVVVVQRAHQLLHLSVQAAHRCPHRCLVGRCSRPLLSLHPRLLLAAARVAHWTAHHLQAPLMAARRLRLLPVGQASRWLPSWAGRRRPRRL